MKKVLCHTVYEPNPHGHGGEKRAAQLAELLAERGQERICFKADLKQSISVFYLLYALQVIFVVYGLKRWRSLKTFLRFWKHLSIIIPQIEQFFQSDSDIFIWESTKENYYYLPYFAKKYGKKVIAYPHNLESLVPGEKGSLSGLASPKGFQKEIAVLKQCDKVYAISREETLFLKLFGVSADYLPYHPPKEIEVELLKIQAERLKRKPNTKKLILMLGSAINPPTRLGIENRIDFFRNNQLNNIDLRVAGYETKNLKEKVENIPNITLLGELSEEQLKIEMINADGLLVYQPVTSGALTRIREFLMAGIPVLANESSARSYYGENRLFTYTDDNMLFNLINSL